ncbi:DUF4326 domain-containing protein [Streptomyces sparsogenes]|uniref:DUF4326 domain-containing protein n=1 Tax=Streptomyces sparsogenes TaxID=67365 RepID=UPI0033D1A78F
MSDAAVAWIAQHVIADYHLANETVWWCDPDQNWEPLCACQMTCTLCQAGRHSQCLELRQTPWAGQHGVFAPRPETHLRRPAPHSPQHTRPLYVAVWLADRSCRYLCDCPQCAGPHHRALSAATGPTTVVCLKGRRGDPDIADVVYVGRPMYRGGWTLHGHPLANPFKVGRDGDAAEVVEKYRAWVDKHPQLLARELPKLRGRRLGCWCAEGQPCHARVLAELADQEAAR